MSLLLSIISFAYYIGITAFEIVVNREERNCEQIKPST